MCLIAFIAVGRPSLLHSVSVFTSFSRATTRGGRGEGAPGRGDEREKGAGGGGKRAFSFALSSSFVTNRAAVTHV
jgi:hypothetical protein